MYAHSSFATDSLSPPSSPPSPAARGFVKMYLASCLERSSPSLHRAFLAFSVSAPLNNHRPPRCVACNMRNALKTFSRSVRSTLPSAVTVSLARLRAFLSTTSAASHSSSLGFRHSKLYTFPSSTSPPVPDPNATFPAVNPSNNPRRRRPPALYTDRDGFCMARNEAQTNRSQYGLTSPQDLHACASILSRHNNSSSLNDARTGSPFSFSSST
mmetsp:Transcript_7202/g.10723  ORF Transcript_7202/g.10723 Transcript_7202/m.10723 type:complete len:213 (-) Transcript_7202:336-974(-)